MNQFQDPASQLEPEVSREITNIKALWSRPTAGQVTLELASVCNSLSLSRFLLLFASCQTYIHPFAHTATPAAARVSLVSCRMLQVASLSVHFLGAS